ncbi:anhydro-N-acetylmuramic acid kinase [Fulvivirga sp. RKSG066]|uniref:anhydro-N-acetylmuramic acid kinase n=1 Tax=Fulvivirga aurantia TaxID=2529383 RepID=UPI0012BCE419|nr:anhydro-N-acetylmuramic acid kinase [Fulvivirga aurantia]MTI22155.1 anhydro-N-acetylmuramic acid kinase [Fulvivirga aurantia]
MDRKNNYQTIGLMSGTSLDGLDIAFCEFFLENHRWKFDCKVAETISYPENLLKKLKAATTLSGEELTYLDIELGGWIGEVVAQFINKKALKVDFISSHGHTVFHQPHNGMTLQIGSGLEMHLATDLPVINDFRSKDVALGGQGAPLVPIGDQLLFSEYDYCINLGGIANVSFEQQGKRVAFDIAPCNMILNRLTEKLGHRYDENGNQARSGNVNAKLLERLNSWTYYKESHPKSLGYEQIANEVFPLLDNSNLPITDLLATYTTHIAEAIAQIFPIDGKEQHVLITGGGAYNSFLIDKLKAFTPELVKISKADKKLIDFKEAIIFAFLGVLRMRKETNCLSSVTGASTDSSSGVIFE